MNDRPKTLTKLKSVPSREALCRMNQALERENAKLREELLRLKHHCTDHRDATGQCTVCGTC